jgi:hypothetical protein
MDVETRVLALLLGVIVALAVLGLLAPWVWPLVGPYDVYSGPTLG